MNDSVITWSSESAIVPAAAVEDMHKMNHNWSSVPLIQCRDCKLMDEIQPETNQPCSTDPDGFCAWGVRRDV